MIAGGVAILVLLLGAAFLLGRNSDDPVASATTPVAVVEPETTSTVPSAPTTTTTAASTTTAPSTTVALATTTTAAPVVQAPISPDCPSTGVLAAAGPEGLDLPSVFLRIGSAADVALEQLLECFGPPTDDTKWITSSFENGTLYCSEANLERHLSWQTDARGLYVTFVDGGIYAPSEPLFIGYSVSGATPTGVQVTTADGVGPGMTRADLAALYPDVEPWLSPWDSEYWEIGEPPVLAYTGELYEGLAASVSDGFVYSVYLGPGCGE